MQMFGIGILEITVVLFLAAVFVGPERLPAFAADLAKWIRQARRYGNHLMRDFNEVVSDLEKEAGASREDWKEIASVITHHTGGMTKEIEKAVGQLEKAANIEDNVSPDGAASNVIPMNGRNGDSSADESLPLGERTEAEGPAEPEANTEPTGDAAQPWYVPERTTRRRARD